MLTDSFPLQRKAEWECLLDEPDNSTRRRKLEAWLDRGHGACWLGREDVASVVQDVLTDRNGRDYGLKAWVVMPNHVHVVVDICTVPLVELVRSWKGRSARLSNRQLKRKGTFWQRDYFDTVIRDEAHLARSVRYVENNPVKAFLVKDPRLWRWSSACLRDQFGSLPGRIG